MAIQKFFKDNFTWGWRAPILILICLIPSVIIALVAEPKAGLGVVIGLIPAAFQGVEPKRKMRVGLLILGLLLPASIFVGTLLKTYAGMWLSALGMGLLGLGAVLLSAKHKAAYLATALVVPSVGIGLSYDTLRAPEAVFIFMAAGSLLAFLVALCFPGYTPAPGRPIISPQHGIVKRHPPPPLAAKVFGLLLGLALATSTLLGFGWDHTGWVVGSTGFVMRPSEKMQESRSLWRIGSIFAGAAAASLFLALQPGGLLTVGVAGLMLALAGALSKSRAYIMPGFLTFIIFMVMLYPARDGTAVLARFLERVGWVAVGILVACFYGMLVPMVLNKLRHEKGVIRGIAEYPTRAYSDAYHRLNDLLDGLAEQGAALLREKGCQARAQTRAEVNAHMQPNASRLPHKTVATRAGLGWIGKCALLVTPEYGSMVRLSAILTDAPLPLAEPVNTSRCGDCTACQKACPASAVSGRTWAAGLPARPSTMPPAVRPPPGRGRISLWGSTPPCAGGASWPALTPGGILIRTISPPPPCTKTRGALRAPLRLYVS